MDYSLFVQMNGKKHEIALYKYTDIFPIPNKYLKVELPNKEIMYAVLNVVESEFDSGLRYTLDDGTVYQVCNRCPFNIPIQYLQQGDYIADCSSVESTYKYLRSVFDERVSLNDDGSIRLVAPTKVTGITKLFICGVDISISCEDRTLTTYHNAHYGHEHNMVPTPHAMVVELVPTKIYTIRIGETLKNDLLPISNCIMIGETVEQLTSKTFSYESLLEADNIFMLDNDIITNQFSSEDIKNSVNNVKTKLFNSNPFTLDNDLKKVISHKYVYIKLE